MNEKQKSQIREIINIHDKYKNSFFWTPPSVASSRRAQEFDNQHEFRDENQFVFVRQKLDISCKNYYYSLEVYVNDIKKDIRALKKLL